MHKILKKSAAIVILIAFSAALNAETIPNITINLNNTPLSCAEPSSEYGTNLKGINLNLGICNSVKELIDRGYYCSASAYANGPYCGGAPQYDSISFSSVSCNKGDGPGISFQWLNDISEKIYDIRPGGYECARPIINDQHLIEFSEKHLENLLENKIESIFFPCEELNTCTISAVDFAMYLTQNIGVSDFQQDNFGNIRGRSKYGEIFVIGSYSPSLSIRRGALDNYNPGGITLD